MIYVFELFYMYALQQSNLKRVKRAKDQMLVIKEITMCFRCT